ncbi:PREDICTED: protein disulfide-isomerase TMX3-like isoform X2 [Poecilia mexicana]|uniref:protein disulfide-isomerase TMX3-like isoform X2 n=1 Tax=Poecilia mexicana TaxID=48701 RepID=UPI00072E65A8|nr:PREDICTED: protein disulfide-isomerase TMX3-like isoform X2 [Poecilia mexicana]
MDTTGGLTCCDPVLERPGSDPVIEERVRSAGLLLLVPVLLGSAFVEELDDTFMETTDPEEIWLIQFYAPWCSFCKQLDPVWHQIGSELRSLGSPVRVGKSDATVNTGLAKEFKIRNYPAILMLKNNVKFNYPGSRTKESIMDFIDRVSGPLVRSLSSTRLFQHAISHHDVLVVYVGATSELKGNLTAAAEELIVHTYFFSASREILPQEVTLTSLPAVLLFKDGTYFIYDEEQDGDLKSWIKRERFPNFFLIDGYTLYAMGESGKLVLLALLEERHLCEENLRYKHLVEKVATEHKDTYGRKFYFGFMEDSGYIDGLIMGEALVPSLMVVNLSNDGYFLPPAPIETELQLLDFLDGVLDGSVEALGGNCFTQRVRRFLYETRMTLMPVFRDAPVLGCFLIGFPLAVGCVFCYLCIKNRPGSADDDEDTPLLAPSMQRKKKLTEKKSD